MTELQAHVLSFVGIFILQDLLDLADIPLFWVEQLADAGSHPPELVLFAHLLVAENESIESFVAVVVVEGQPVPLIPFELQNTHQFFGIFGKQVKLPS